MKEPEAVRCPTCGDDGTVEASAANPYQRLHRCASCGHAFVSSRNLDEDKNKALQLEHFGEKFAAREGFFINLYDRLNARRTARALNLEPRSRVLEIGPGSGVVMGWFANLGHDVVGLDLSPAVARHVEQRWHLRVLVESLDAHIRSAGEAGYDAIIMRHVLEHFSDPLSLLQAVRAALKPGGKLYVAVPNMDSWHRHFRGWSGYEPYHLHYFGNSSLRFALRQAGFTLSETATYESLTGWTNTIMRSLMEQRDVQAGPLIQRGNWRQTILESLRLFVGIVSSPLRWIQARLRRGEELTAICLKAIA